MLTIELTGPQGCGKTETKRWLEENLPVAINGVRFRDDEGGLIVKIVDPSGDAERNSQPVRRRRRQP